MKLIKPTFSKNDLCDGRVDSTPVENLPGMVQDFCQDFKSHMLASRDNRVEFKRMWGDPAFKVKFEFLTSVYQVKEGATEFIIFTAKGRGTSIEFLGPLSETTVEDAKKLHKNLAAAVKKAMDAETRRLFTQRTKRFDSKSAPAGSN